MQRHDRAPQINGAADCPAATRPVQIWVPDVRSPDFAGEAHRQSALVAAADRASDDMDFVEAVSDDRDE